MTDPTSPIREQNLLAQQTLAGIIADRAFDRLEEVVATDVVDHDPAPGADPGIEGIRQFWISFTTAFPDAELTPRVVSADDDGYVTAVLDIEGTNTRPFEGNEPTGDRIKVRGIQTALFRDGKIVERWGVTDQLGMMQQLGHTPSNP